MRPQLSRQDRLHCADPFRCGHDVHVFQRSEQPFACVEMTKGCHQRWMLAESKQYWHQGVTLLSSFALVYVVGDTLVVLPPTGGRGAMELPDEGNDVWSNAAQSLQHGGNEVECPNSVDGHHR